MAKKKHRKKAQASKHPGPPKTSKARARRSKAPKRATHHHTAAHSDADSLAFLRAVKRRRDAGRDTHHESHRGGGHRRGKAGGGRHPKRAHHHGEPIITEKSFENMLALRRFQDHAR